MRTLSRGGGSACERCVINRLDAVFGVSNKNPPYFILGVVWGVPQVRLHTGFVTAPNRRPSFEFIRASQGHSLPFIAEERLATPRPDAITLKSATVALWHATNKAFVKRILDNGLVTGGTRCRREAVHIAPVPFWDEDYKGNYLKFATTFVDRLRRGGFRGLGKCGPPPSCTPTVGPCCPERGRFATNVSGSASSVTRCFI